jgi:hypothetical protein
MSRFLAKRLQSRRAKLIVAVVVALAVAAGAAAYFTSTGSGSGSASVGSTQAVTISPGTALTPLYPGGSGDVALAVTNPNTVRVVVNGLALDTSQGTNGFDVDAGHSGCDLSVLSFTAQNNGGSGWSVPARAGETGGPPAFPIDLPPTAISMSTGAASACQGASFKVYLKVAP